MTDRKSVEDRIEDLEDRLSELEDEFESIQRRDDEDRMMDEYGY